MPRIEVGVGSEARFVLHKPVSRIVSLSGMQMKTEITDVIEGRIIKIWDEPEGTTPEGKPDFVFEVKLKHGEVVVMKRSNVKFCYLSNP